MTSLVFFGAGASRPFGIPTMQEMVTEFENEIKDKHPECYEFYCNLKKTLVKEYDEKNIDIESIFSVLDGITSQITIKELGYYPYYHIQEFYKLKETLNSDENIFNKYTSIAKSTKTILKEFIRNSCKIKLSDPEREDIYRKSYVAFFSNIKGKSQDYSIHKLIADWKAYTTNYDSVFENFWNGFEPVKDNFQKEPNSNNYFFGNNDLSEHSLSKLHGSLDWTKEIDTGRILRKNEFGYRIYKTQGEVMLFPIQQKDLYLHPWFTLFSDLHKGLHKKSMWYVVGYAFNDEFILNTFQEILSNNSDKVLSIINPDAENIISKFTESTRERIRLLPIKFGSDFFERQLSDHVNHIKTLIVRIVSRADKFYIKCHNQTVCSHSILNSNDVKYDDVFGDTSDKLKLIFNSHKNMIGKEIKIELKIEYNFGETIELTISDDTSRIKFGIDYCDLPIATSHDIVDWGRDHMGHAVMKEPIVLDKTKLYRE